MKRLATTITATLATLAALFLLWQLRSIVLLFVLSLTIAAMMHAPVDRLVNQKLPRWLAMVVVYAATLLLFAGLLVLVLPQLATEIDTLTRNLAQAYSQGYGSVDANNPAYGGALFNRMPSFEDAAQAILESQPMALAQHLFGLTQNFIYIMGQGFLAVVLSAYWLMDEVRFERLWLSLMPPLRRTRARKIWRALESNVGAYVRSEIIQSFTIGALLTGGYLLFGLDYPFLMAAIGAVAWFIPLAGILLALLLITLISLLNGLLITIGMFAYTALVFAAMEFVIEPRLYDRSQYGYIGVILVMMAMVYTFGLFGLLLAPPLALAVQIVLDELMTRPPKEEPTVAVEFDDLHQRTVQLKEYLAQNNVAAPRIDNMVTRLEDLLQEVVELRQPAVPDKRGNNQVIP
ncbi:MAG: AI-2E family transporter [Caldilineaceae bacterium]